ncbi:MAG: diaminopimelate epimerase [Proteobacteria bacterium]|nr:diaminopimelate epimerase [Pseudomonadota bacterium]
MSDHKKAKVRTFVKMHGTGNDFIVFDCLKASIANPAHAARKLCDRHFGIGADQMLLLVKSRKCDFGMRVFNADGSEADMCGNGIRCVAKYIKDARLSAKKELCIETLAGPRTVKGQGKVFQVDMGEPVMKGKDIPVNLSGRIVNRPLKTETKEFRITCVGMGNPHCVTFHENLEGVPIDKYGPMLEHYSIFPKRVNISFVNVVSKQEIQARVWERGSGMTLGCGTAACAATVASVLNGFTDRKVTVALPGGKLDIEWSQKDNHVYMKGPAETVFTGQIAV